MKRRELDQMFQNKDQEMNQVFEEKNNDIEQKKSKFEVLVNQYEEKLGELE